MEGYKYIILPCSTTGDNLPNGPRVVRFPTDGALSLSGQYVYDSEHDLKRNHPYLQRLKKDNPKRFEQIFKPEYIITVENFALTLANDFDGDSFKVLLHSLTGEFSRNGVHGIHFVDPNSSGHVRIIEIIRGPDKFGIREVKLEVFNTNRNSWVPKEKSSTIFPASWTLTQLILECSHAYQNKEKTSNKDYEWSSSTLTGVPVKIIIGSNGKLKSIYPIISNDELGSQD